VLSDVALNLITIDELCMFLYF